VTVRQPLAVVDDWAVLSDGSIAIVRGADYHVDWIYANGKRASTPRMPFEWRRLSAADKIRLVDSIRSVDTRMRLMADSMRRTTRTGIVVNPPPLDSIVPIAEIPDYYPPIRGNSVFADRDNHLWTLQSTPSPSGSGLLYDVIDTHGQIVERVRTTAGCAIVGFAPLGIVYQVCTHSGTGGTARTFLHEARIER
jgi:hypothetical protein